VTLSTLILASIRSPGAVAAIGAAAGVAGAVAGAAAGGIATFKIEGRRQDFERRRLLRAERQERRGELALTRAAARLLRRHFEHARAALRSSIENGDWWPENVEINIALPVEDMRRVAAALDVAGWVAVDVADYGIGMMSLRYTSFRTVEGSSWEAHARQAAEEALPTITAAISALDELAQAEPDVEPWR
jgi:hypothetical protein